jgi:hypothetical protein
MIAGVGGSPAIYVTPGVEVETQTLAIGNDIGRPARACHRPNPDSDHFPIGVPRKTELGTPHAHGTCRPVYKSHIPANGLFPLDFLYDLV